MFGWRGRIGLIVPSSDGTCEAEFANNCPDGVAVHSSRIFLEDGVVDADSLEGMNDGIDRSAELLATVEPDVIAYACTTGSLVEGVGYERSIEDRIAETADVPSVATAASIKRAFDALEATSIAVATPYVDDLNAREREFLEDSGYVVVDVDGLGLETDTEFGRQSPETAYRQARALDHADADCVFISCTGYHTAPIVEPLEADLGKPVVTSNQATLWDALRTMGVDDAEVSLGTLFEH
ncbi:maleate cis-trans isomerase family protein [Halopiger goleimassiliensis]|uniref:maleate cis-trans isomerase family protein n=1 Tax=Halopiger goleimassiliensis TaxID=1293048 RepID=UPI0006779FA5|nr:aspartate/glutamate racemase family protein [Halopiger goleimassiliensis]